MAINPSNPYSFIKRYVPETAGNIDTQTRSLQSKSALQELVNSGALAKQASANEAAWKKNLATLGYGDLIGNPKALSAMMERNRKLTQGKTEAETRKLRTQAGLDPESAEKTPQVLAARIPKVAEKVDTYAPNKEGILEKKTKTVTTRPTTAPTQEAKREPVGTDGRFFVGDTTTHNGRPAIITGKTPQGKAIIEYTD